jgi:hypothetical protein
MDSCKFADSCLWSKDRLQASSGFFVWKFFATRLLHSMHVTCGPNLQAYLKHVYNYYHRADLQSTHDFNHTHETFRTGVYLFKQTENAYFWNVDECTRLTYCVALLTHDADRSTWWTRDHPQIFPKIGLRMAEEYSLNIDRNFYRVLVQSLSLRRKTYCVSEKGSVHLLDLLKVLIKLADHSFMFNSWSRHLSSVQKRFAKKNPEDEDRTPAFMTDYSHYYVLPLMLNLKSKRALLGERLLRRYQKNVNRWGKRMRDSQTGP